MKPSRGPRGQQGSAELGAVSGSAHTLSTDTQTRHVDRHRPRTRTLNDAPPNTHHQTRAPETWTQARHGHAEPRPHKSAGRCTSPDPNPQRPANAGCTCPHKDPERGPAPPARAFVSLEPSPPGLGSPLPPSPGRPAAAADTPGPGKVRRPDPCPGVQRRRPPDGAARLGSGAPDFGPHRGLPLPPGDPHPPGRGSVQMSLEFWVHREAQSPSCTRPALFPVPRVPPPGPRPPAAGRTLRPPDAQWRLQPAAARLRERGQSAGLSWSAPRLRFARGARAEPGFHPRERLKSAYVVPAHCGRLCSRLPGTRIPARLSERTSHLRRWPAGSGTSGGR